MMRRFGRGWRKRSGRRRLRAKPNCIRDGETAAQISLEALQPGNQAVVLSYSQGLAPERLAQLLAYGMIPGVLVQVIQHVPVTVVRIEHTELALDQDLAGQIWVAPASKSD